MSRCRCHSRSESPCDDCDARAHEEPTGETERGFELAEPSPLVHLRGDPLGRSYTPDALALAIMRRLRSTFPTHLGPGATVLEPCVGGGAFARAARAVIPGAYVMGWDIDPEARGALDCERFYVCDAAAEELVVGMYSLAVTNPPFGAAVGQGVTLAIVRAARAHATICAMLLPLEYACQDGWASEIDECCAIWRVIGRPWTHQREVAVYVWREHERGPAVATALRWKPSR